MTQPDPPDTNEPPSLEDLFDVVKTQGACLRTCPPTPHHGKVNLEEHAAQLYDTLEFLARMLKIRRKRYGPVADEWPPGYTPTEIVEWRKAEVERLFALAEAPSPPTPTPSSPNSEGAPKPAPPWYQSPLPAPEWAALDLQPGKRRLCEDTGEESVRKKSRRVAAIADHQPQLPSPDDPVTESVAITSEEAVTWGYGGGSAQEELDASSRG